jgi:phospholipase/carboxylesterase
MLRILGLHGSSGHPAFMRDFTDRLAPDMTALLPQGQFADGEGFTFFRRRADFSIPEAELLGLAREAVSPSGFVPASAPMLAIGYSSGAIFATALLATAPQRFAGAILLRPQPISEDFAFPDLSGKPVLILSGLQDIRRQPQHAPELEAQLRRGGAEVTHHALEAGHGLAEDDARIAAAWMEVRFGA